MIFPPLHTLQRIPRVTDASFGSCEMTCIEQMHCTDIFTDAGRRHKCIVADFQRSLGALLHRFRAREHAGVI